MNGFAIFFLLLNAAAMWSLPRRWAPLPLLAAVCYITPAQRFMVGPFHFTVLRALLSVGIIRAMARQERLEGKLNGLDWLILAWGAVILGMSVFHQPFNEVLVYRLGLVYNAFGMYFLFRVYCRTTEEVTQLLAVAAMVLVPVALEMANEKLTGRNLFAAFGDISDAVLVRDGKLRASGASGNCILAGTVGALCVPLMVAIWRQHRRSAMVGLAASLTIVAASTSSGPIMTVAFGVFALLLWRWRHLTRQMRIAAVVGYVLLAMVMHDPPYFLMARIDLTGSSTGWHRAELIRSSLAHLNEWWFAGTDYTRHWMAIGLTVDNPMCDITNHFLLQGVDGGLLLMAIFIGFFWTGFRYVGRSLQLRAEAPFAERFLIWSLGASLFASAVTCLSVAYFDQTIVILYLTLAVIGSLHGAALATARDGISSAAGAAARAGDAGPEPAAGLPAMGDGFLGDSGTPGLPGTGQATF